MIGKIMKKKSSKEEIERLRGHIDGVDEGILDLLSRRAVLVKQVS